MVGKSPANILEVEGLLGSGFCFRKLKTKQPSFKYKRNERNCPRCHWYSKLKHSEPDASSIMLLLKAAAIETG
jgi:hypothetical protein